MPIEIRIFKEAIDVISKIWNGFKKISNIPPENRKFYREQFRETLTLIDSALVMMIVRLGDLLALAKDDKRQEFSNEIGRLDNVSEWIEIEREFRICRNLRIAKSEMRGIIDKFKINVSVSNRDLFEESFGKIFALEEELGYYIGDSLKHLSAMKDMPLGSEEDLDKVVEEITKFREFLKTERDELILLEIEIIKNI